jgi:pimeloyl-ACP methyl ester carboxylesterase
MSTNKFIEVNNVKIFCDISGSGMPLVFLHGNRESHKAFAHQIVFFEQICQVIAIDTRGHGNSEHDGRHLSIPLLASDLKAILDYLNLRKVNIVGFNDGGNVALAFASVYYEYVDKLVLVGANATPKGLKVRAKYEIKRDYYEAKVRALFMRKYRHEANLIQLQINQPQISRDKLALIRAKTLLLAGDHDIVTKRHLKYLHKSIPESLLHIIPNASHFLIQEYPELFNTIVFEFLYTE